MYFIAIEMKSVHATSQTKDYKVSVIETSAWYVTMTESTR